MTRVLLYAPMNPPAPGAPPSGDRAMTSLLAKTLALKGYSTEAASSLRSYESQGNANAQAAIAAEAAFECERLISAYRADPPAAWLTYMNYYKSPDHLGPVVARALGIPYVIVEASYAAKRAEGVFAAPHAAAKLALESADVVFAMTQHDHAGLFQIVPADRLHLLKPFIDTALFQPPRRRRARTTPVILTVAMLRPGKKMANFPLIAAALARLADLKWTWILAGGGDGLAEAQAAFQTFPRDRVTFAGPMPREKMPGIYGLADIYLWPGLREAYGLSYLEAQACGLPVVACATHGVPAVVQQGRGGLLSPAGDPDGLAMSLRVLLSNQLTRETMGEVASEFVHTERDLAHAADQLESVLRPLIR
jgi:glycosyltransferase involved in cell wall biosynthesis